LKEPPPFAAATLSVNVHLVMVADERVAKSAQALESMVKLLGKKPQVLRHRT